MHQIKTGATHFTTNQFSEAIGSKSTTIHRSLCTRGHYLGIGPVKLPNGRLLWPASELQRLLASSEE